MVSEAVSPPPTSAPPAGAHRPASTVSSNRAPEPWLVTARLTPSAIGQVARVSGDPGQWAQGVEQRLELRRGAGQGVRAAEPADRVAD